MTENRTANALWRVLSPVAAGVLVAAGVFHAPGVSAFDAGTPLDVPSVSAPVHVQDINPEAASRSVHQNHSVVRTSHYMASTANPLATQAGVDVLAEGGSAADAVIASQMVLNLVEPQSSGIGGGAFIVSYNATSKSVHAYDGRETAPASARSDRFMKEGRAIPFWAAVNSGLSVGTPGLIRGLALMHQQDGRLSWARLFAPAIVLAEEGFPVSERLHALLKNNNGLRDQSAAAAYFYDAQGEPWPIGHKLVNKALADVFRQVAEHGPKAFYEGGVAREIVKAVAGHSIPGDLSLEDLSGYRALERIPLCAPYKVYTLCGMPPPSSGPLTVIQMLNILSHTDIAELQSDSLEAVHYFSEAGKLAYADRDVYVADPAFIDVPVHAMLNPEYLALRASLIQPDRTIGRAPPGDPAGMLAIRGKDDSPQLPSTTHVSAVDAQGNVVSMTSTIESAFGSKIFVRGFLLNNQLTDFSLSDVDEHGKPVANRLEPLKRPRSSMAPMLVLRDGKPVMAIGSPGGSAIINYVAKTLLGVLDWELNIQQAIDLPNRGSRNSFTELEKGTSLHRLVNGLRAMGHEVREVDFPSGLQGIVLTPEGLEGGSDPRREGVSSGR